MPTRSLTSRQPLQLLGLLGAQAETSRPKIVAKLAGVMETGDALTPQLQEFTLLIMEKCADVGDKYTSSKHGRTAGDEIRALFGVY